MPKRLDHTPSDLPDDLQALLDYQPPQLIRSSDHPSGIAYSPLDFYDLHLHENLRLKRVVLLPDLATNIASRVDEVRSDLETQGLIPPYPMALVDPEIREELGGYNTVVDPDSLASFYAQTTGRSCVPLASVWVVHPQWKYASTVIDFAQRGGGLPDHDFLSDKWSLRVDPFKNIPTAIRDAMNSGRSLSLQTLENKPLATWVFMPLCSDAESALEGMDALVTDLSLLNPVTTGHPQSRVKLKKPPRDSPRPVFNLPEAGGVPEGHRPPPARRRTAVYPQGPNLKAPLQRSPRRLVSGSDIIQHAWTHAVRHDTTFIVIHAGNFERVAIRHRASQSLYLSNVIDISNCEKPAYGRIHAGLYLAIVQDALDRTQPARNQAPASSGLGKRKRKGTMIPAARKSPRQEINLIKSRMITPRASVQDGVTWRALNTRILALIYVDDGVFDSPTPTSCARVGPSLSKYGIGESYAQPEEKFAQSEAMRIVLGPCFAIGGTGVLHYATIHLDALTRAQKPVHVEVIVKLAITPRNRRHVRHEYRVYKHLWEHGVRGILPVYGLFEDFQGVATLLVLGKGGIPLHRREHGLSNKVSVTPKERDMFMSILHEIHKAGVGHGDIHPGNLLVDATGQGYVIDFEHSRIDWNLEARDIEVETLSDILDGKGSGDSIAPFTCSSVSTSDLN
ncbi:hypothetical protein BDN72DRAFT_964654 [Pluteus cervinus]|uniref:Uncharacterized protein n=1 Tax=Pluteus cervinus TaxID=181527 RepID=A0ACD3A988_9AGAR|nr:hypothetical protein BDN72DRAFT_964654 [Pluteus cervinus]